MVMTMKSIDKQIHEEAEREQEYLDQAQALRREYRSMDGDVTSLSDKKQVLEEANQTEEQKIHSLSRHLEEARRTAEEKAREVSEAHMKAGQLKQRQDFIMSSGERFAWSFQRSKRILRHLAGRPVLSIRPSETLSGR